MRAYPTLAFITAALAPLVSPGQDVQTPDSRVDPAPRQLEQVMNSLPKGDSTIRPGPVFYPPIPPTLDRPSPELRYEGPAQRSVSPAVAPFVDEIFYAALAPRFDEQTTDPLPLSRWQLSRLADYQKARDAAYGELRDTLHRTRHLEPAGRRQALIEFARQQTPRLVQLEQTAEELRRDFSIRDWRELRQWRLDEPKARRGDSPEEIAGVMRAYGYFQKNLSLSQRRLLREIFVEVAQATADPADAARQRVWYFSPELARIVLPDTIPPALAARLGAYETRKSALKKELYDAIYAAERPSGLFGGYDFQALARRQAPQFAALEVIAEEIRVDLAQLPARGRPLEASQLPPALQARVLAWSQANTALHASIVAAVQALSATIAGKPVQIWYNIDVHALTYKVVPRIEPKRWLGPAKSIPTRDEKRELFAEITERMDTIAANHADRFRAQAAGFAAIRQEIQALMPQASAWEIDQAFAIPMRTAIREQKLDAFDEYYAAILEPGLSIEQRRLLFGSAVVHFELPLPRGEIQPTYRAD